MIKHVKIALFSVLVSIAYGQTSICLGTDATICMGDQITINDCSNIGGSSSGVPYTMALIPYSPDPFGTPNTVNLSDDQFSGVINIGFDFCFYGNTYDQVLISSNNYISFDLANANGYSSWVTTAVPDPTSNTTFNSIMCPWQDINPGVGGTITYATYGTAPNRRFVVTWDNVPMFSCTGQLYSSQIKIFESTNYVETHIVNKTICGSWNSGNAVHGVHAPNGTDALTVPGRNNTQWTVNNEGYEFVPQSAIVWMDTDGNSYPYNAGSLTVTPVPTPPSDSIGYFLKSEDNCGSGFGISDTSWITVGSSAVSATGTDDICSAGLGTVTATPLAGIQPYTFNWPTLGSTNSTVNGVTSGTYQVEMTDGNGCTSTASVTIGDTPASFQGTTTVVSCPGGSDGTATADMIPVIGNVTYQWDTAAGNQTTQTATGLSAGQYTCLVTSDIGCTGTVIVDVTEIPGMIGTIASQSDVSCNSGNNGIMDVSVNLGTAPYSYSWDNSTSTANFANDLYAGTHTVTVTDANGCVITVTGTIGEPPALMVTSLTPDTQICPEDDIMLNVAGTGGSSPYTFTWFENGVQIGTGTSITVDPVNTNTQYCVELSEACGSPTDQECNLIYFPTPIVPSAIPDESEKCLPGGFIFVNTSSNPSEIATTFWEFGNQLWAIENGTDTTSHTYNQVGTYDITMTITSIYGCVYSDTLFSLVEVKPNPIADFTFSSNPTTIFNTTVQMQNASSVDAIYFDWYSLGSSPAFSNSESPWFTFPSELGTFPVTLIVETERGCTDTTTLELNVVDDVICYAPNTFTPDNDEFNQTWRLHMLGIDIYDFELLIYNRWGQLIWESHDVEVEWDGYYNGVPVQEGTYTWIARVKRLYNDDKLTFNGSIIVIR